MKVSYKTNGLNSYLKAVARKSPEVKEAVGRVIQRSALRVEKGAKTKAPFDTGHLSNSIYSEKTGELQAMVISPVHYSIYQEMGTRKMNAHPFMLPSLKEEDPRLMALLKRMFGK